jgi:hypothetical protein
MKWDWDYLSRNQAVYEELEEHITLEPLDGVFG